ncbi:MAG: ribose 5-phosphate isomerase B [Desulfatirhabdiaceae bacterium]|nr:ribose 5-phosphate isomerase B [Desulfatirhabdiaceae bacterium]
MEDDRTPIILGCDHAAYDLKEYLKTLIKQKGIEIKDIGAHSAEAVDYPDFGFQVAGAVSTGEYSRGILLCGTGLGMSIVANKFSHVRAALCNDLFSAIMSRRHNNANILVMGGRVIGDVLAKEIVTAWLQTPFEGGRHQRRLDKFENMGCLVQTDTKNCSQ